MIQPRDYQIESVNAVFRALDSTPGDQLCAMPGGTGKSVCIAGAICTAFYRKPTVRVLILTHVKKLIEQNHAKLKEIWPGAPAGIYSAGLNRRDLGAPILFAGIASVAKIADQLGHYDYLFIDECHLVGDSDSSQYLQTIAALRRINPGLRIVGWSASIYRLGMGLLTEGGIFNNVCFDITRREDFARLIAAGYLCPLISKPTPVALDITGVTKSGNDYNQKQLEAAVNTDDLVRAACAEIVREAAANNRTRWLIFAAGVKHVEHIAKVLRNEHGVSCVTMHSKMPGKQCDENERAFIAGEITACVTNNMFTTGVDCPEIDLIAFLRPTISTSLWVQMLSRGTRPAPWIAKPNCLILDFARNTERLGPITDPHIPRGKRKPLPGDEQQGAPVRLCPHCRTYSHARAPVCEQCGAEFPAVIKIDATASTASVMDFEAPKVERLPVTLVTYNRHKKKDRPDSLRVQYVSGATPYNEFICFEHGDKFHARAAKWWRERMPHGPIPTTVSEALEAQRALAQPHHIHVWANPASKYPEIMRYEF